MSGQETGGAGANADQLDVAGLFRLDGRVAWVSGATGGIGSEIAKALARQGAQVVVSARGRQSCDRLAAQIEDAGGEAISAPGDLTEPGVADGAAQAALGAFGRLDILVQCAGGNARHDAALYPMTDWRRILDLNLSTTFLACQAAARIMIPRRRGRILAISSVRSLLGIHQGYAAYCAAKGAVNALTRQLATEWAAYGIAVNALAPTFVRTPQVADMLGDEGFYRALVARIPLGRIAEPSDLVGPALLLCSDAGAFVTGQILFVDGGLTACQ